MSLTEARVTRSKTRKSREPLLTGLTILKRHRIESVKKMLAWQYKVPGIVFKESIQFRSFPSDEISRFLAGLPDDNFVINALGTFCGEDVAETCMIGRDTQPTSQMSADKVIRENLGMCGIPTTSFASENGSVWAYKIDQLAPTVELQPFPSFANATETCSQDAGQIHCLAIGKKDDVIALFSRMRFGLPPEKYAKVGIVAVPIAYVRKLATLTSIPAHLSSKGCVSMPDHAHPLKQVPIAMLFYDMRTSPFESESCVRISGDPPTALDLVSKIHQDHYVLCMIGWPRADGRAYIHLFVTGSHAYEYEVVATNLIRWQLAAEQKSWPKKMSLVPSSDGAMRIVVCNIRDLGPATTQGIGCDFEKAHGSIPRNTVECIVHGTYNDVMNLFYEIPFKPFHSARYVGIVALPVPEVIRILERAESAVDGEISWKPL